MLLRVMRSVKALNAKMCHDDRVEVSMIPIGDGISLARKRGGPGNESG
jgi:predicted O-methyltransferase YrrM